MRPTPAASLYTDADTPPYAAALQDLRRAPAVRFDDATEATLSVRDDLDEAQASSFASWSIPPNASVA
jgi:hypothetical protein